VGVAALALLHPTTGRDFALRGGGRLRFGHFAAASSNIAGSCAPYPNKKCQFLQGGGGTRPQSTKPGPPKRPSIARASKTRKCPSYPSVRSQNRRQQRHRGNSTSPVNCSGNEPDIRGHDADFPIVANLVQFVRGLKATAWLMPRPESPPVVVTAGVLSAHAWYGYTSEGDVNEADVHGHTPVDAICRIWDLRIGTYAFCDETLPGDEWHQGLDAEKERYARQLKLRAACADTRDKHGAAAASEPLVSMWFNAVFGPGADRHFRDPANRGPKGEDYTNPEVPLPVRAVTNNSSMVICYKCAARNHLADFHLERNRSQASDFLPSGGGSDQPPVYATAQHNRPWCCRRST